MKSPPRSAKMIRWTYLKPLGSVPGRMSLERGEHYANPKNGFRFLTIFRQRRA